MNKPPFILLPDMSGPPPKLQPQPVHVFTYELVPIGERWRCNSLQEAVEMLGGGTCLGFKQGDFPCDIIHPDDEEPRVNVSEDTSDPCRVNLSFSAAPRIESTATIAVKLRGEKDSEEKVCGKCNGRGWHPTWIEDPEDQYDGGHEGREAWCHCPQGVALAKDAAMKGRAFGVALKDIEMGQLVTLDDVRLINQHVTVKD